MTELNSFTRKMIFIGIAALFGSMSMIVRASAPAALATSQSIIDVDQLDDGTEILRFRVANYSSFNRTIKYNSTTMNDPKGMAPLYKISNQILDMFLGDDVIPEGYIRMGNNFNLTMGPKIHDHQQWIELVKYYWPILLVVLISALIIVLMPIVGLCVCCCRCAGSCGGRSQPFDKKHDTCRRVFLGFFLILVATGLVFNVIIAFATNYLLQQGVENTTTMARYGVGDTQEFLHTASLQSNHILVKNYDELSDHLELMLKDAADVVTTKLKEESKAVYLTQLATFVELLPHIKGDLNRMKDITNGLRANASQLSDGLRSVKRELLQSLSKCQMDMCKKVLKEYEIGKLDVNGIDYDQLPDVTSLIGNVDDLISEEDIQTISESQQKLENIRKDINDTIHSRIPEVTDSIRRTGGAIKNISHVIDRTFDQISDQTGSVNNHLNTADAYIKEYYIYVYYVLLGISSTLLLVLMCIVCGLLCGICGKRPDGYGDDCCNKGAGARFLILGVTVIFLTTSILLIVGLVIFLGGLALHRGVCMPLNNPGEDQIFGYLDQGIDLNEILINTHRSKSRAASHMEPLRMSQVIESCHRNETIYKVLKLHNHFNITDIREYPKRFQVDKQLQELVDNVRVPKITILVEDAINKLAESELKNFDVDKFTDNLNEQITHRDLNEIARKLIETADKISPGADVSDVRISLKNQALHLRTYQENLVTPMTEQTKEMLMLSKRLSNNLKFNRSSFEEALNEFITDIRYAQDFINNKGTKFVREAAQKLVTSFKDEINSYLNLVINKTENELGNCGPISNVYKSVVVAGCNRIINPLNGFWTGLIACILLFFPAIIFSLKLSSLYQKSDPYPGQLVEAEYYMYDAYSDRENIPLANGPKNKRRKQNDRRQTSRDRRAEYYEDSGSPHHEPTSSGPREARYNDMAPKHWIGGPPRYQNPPVAPPASEYERPPPYYFPGAPSED